MRIEQIGANGYGTQVSRAKQRERSEEADRKRGGSRFTRDDTYEPSSGPTGKATSLKEVQRRVKNDFYGSDVVNDDLADVFTRLLDR